MRLHEILDTKANINWISTNDGYIGHFSVGDQDFSIKLQVKIAPIQNHEYVIVHAGFGLNDGKDDLYMDLSGLSGRNSLKVFSIVGNGIHDKLSPNHVDFIVLGSTSDMPSERSSRLNIYQRIASKLGSGWNIHNIPTKNGTALVMSLPNINSNVTAAVLNFIKTSSK